MTKQEIKHIITTYTKEHKISKQKYQLYPLYIHLDGFTHSIGFISHAPKKNTHYTNYNSVSYSAYTHDAYGYVNDYQREIATIILSKIPHYMYQNNAKEILF